MMSAEGANRPAKRDVIDIIDDEAKSEHPPEKIVKKETESASSPEFAQLQQQLLKSDEKFKRMCEMAGEYKARVEFLENIIDTKQGIVNREESTDDLRKKVAELTKQLEARERINQQQQSIAVMQPIPDEKPIIKGAGDPINILQSCVSNAPRSMPFDIARDILHALYAKSSLESLVKSCDSIKNETSNCDSCGKEIIGVTKMFHHFFSKDHAEKMFGRSVSDTAVKYWKEKLEQSSSIVFGDNSCDQPIVNICHPTNILQSCDTSTLESMSFEYAREFLHALYAKCSLHSLVRSCDTIENKASKCDSCEKEYVGVIRMFHHFFSNEHAEKMLARNISDAAIDYWKEQLEQSTRIVPVDNDGPRPIVPDPTNIFQMRLFDSSDYSISFEYARELLHSLYDKANLDSLVKSCESIESETRKCEACEEEIIGVTQMFYHFFSTEHAEKWFRRSLSGAAVKYWKEKLEQSIAIVPTNMVDYLLRNTKKSRRAAQQRLADPAAAAAAAEAKKERKRAAKERRKERKRAEKEAKVEMERAKRKARRAAAAAQKHRVQPEPAAAAASVEVKKEIVKVEND